MFLVYFEYLQATNLHYRGARIFNVILEELLAKGLNRASSVSFSLYICICMLKYMYMIRNVYVMVAGSFNWLFVWWVCCDIVL